MNFTTFSSSIAKVESKYAIAAQYVQQKNGKIKIRWPPLRQISQLSTMFSPRAQVAWSNTSSRFGKLRHISQQKKKRKKEKWLYITQRRGKSIYHNLICHPHVLMVSYFYKRTIKKSIVTKKFPCKITHKHPKRIYLEEGNWAYVSVMKRLTRLGGT